MYLYNEHGRKVIMTEGKEKKIRERLSFHP